MNKEQGEALCPFNFSRIPLQLHPMATTRAAQSGWRSFLARYHRHSQGLAVSFIYILPLLVAYEMGMLLLRPPAASWAGDVIRWLLHGAFGRWGALAFNLAVIVAIVASLLATSRRRGVNLDFYPSVMAESLGYGIVLMLGLPLLMRVLLLMAQTSCPAAGGVLDNLVLSIGAGVYEEIVFRLGLMSVIYFLALTLTRENWFATVAAIVLSSVLFAAAHYLDGSTLPPGVFLRSFTYRMISGIIFAAIYIYRGLAVVCYTHAFYDVLVVIMSVGK